MNLVEIHLKYVVYAVSKRDFIMKNGFVLLTKDKWYLVLNRFYDKNNILWTYVINDAGYKSLWSQVHFHFKDSMDLKKKK